MESTRITNNNETGSSDTDYKKVNNGLLRKINKKYTCARDTTETYSE